jgi:hypothetical protein
MTELLEVVRGLVIAPDKDCRDWGNLLTRVCSRRAMLLVTQRKGREGSNCRIGFLQ